MFRSTYLQGLPVLGIQSQQASNYQLRESVHLHQLCTAEVSAAVLKLNGEYEAATALEKYFDVFRTRYMAGRANIILKT